MQGVTIQRAPGPDRTSVTTNYVWQNPLGVGAPGIVRRYVDPAHIVGDMISPFPRSAVKRGGLVHPPSINDTSTLSPASDDKAAAQDNAEPAAIPFPEARVGPELKAPPMPKPIKRKNKERVMKDAPPLPPQPEPVDATMVEGEVAPQAAPTSDAQEVAMADPDPAPEFHDASDMIGLAMESTASAGVSPGLPSARPRYTGEITIGGATFRPGSGSGAIRRGGRQREQPVQPLMSAGGSMDDLVTAVGWTPPSSSPTKDEVAMAEAPPAATAGPAGKGRKGGKAKKYSRNPVDEME